MIAMIASGCADDDKPPDEARATTSTTTFDPDLGYDELTAPTAPPRVLDPDGLVEGFVIAPTEGCSQGALSQLSRVDPASGEPEWVVELPWISRDGVVAAGAWIGWSGAERSSLVAVDIDTGAALWQRFTDETNLVRLSAGSGAVVALSRPRGEDSQVLVARDASTLR